MTSKIKKYPVNIRFVRYYISIWDRLSFLKNVTSLVNCKCSNETVIKFLMSKGVKLNSPSRVDVICWRFL